MAKNPIQSDQRGYSLPVRILHWLMALIMISMILAGLWMVQGPWDGKYPASRSWFYDYHRSMGFVLLVLTIIRLLAYRFTTPPSPLPASIPHWQQMAAELTHLGLYGALIIHPILGWYATNAWGVKKINIFGLFDLPSIAEKNRPLGDFLLEIHSYIGFAIAALVLLHIAAALKHLLIDKDNVFKRMLKT